MSRPTLVPAVVLVVLSSACSTSRPSLTIDERLLVQAYEYGIDSLAKQEGAHRACVALDHGRDISDPPPAVLAVLRDKDATLLAYSECRLGLSALAPVHDTLVIGVTLDSIAAAIPKLRMRTWRGGRWGAGYSCSLRRDGLEWQLGTCQVAWMN